MICAFCSFHRVIKSFAWVGVWVFSFRGRIRTISIGVMRLDADWHTQMYSISPAVAAAWPITPAAPLPTPYDTSLLSPYSSPPVSPLPFPPVFSSASPAPTTHTPYLFPSNAPTTFTTIFICNYSLTSRFLFNTVNSFTLGLLFRTWLNCSGINISWWCSSGTKFIRCVGLRLSWLHAGGSCRNRLLLSGCISLSTDLSAKLATLSILSDPHTHEIFHQSYCSFLLFLLQEACFYLVHSLTFL